MDQKLKKLTKVEITFLVICMCLVLVYAISSVLDRLDIVPGLQWLGFVCMGVNFGITGYLYWKRIKWISVFHYVISVCYLLAVIIKLMWQLR